MIVGQAMGTQNSRPMMPRGSAGQGRRWTVRLKSRGRSGLWKDEWATANCVGALETSPTEDTVVLWSGDLEMNYMDRAAEGAW